MKILSIHDLATIRKRAEHKLSLREESNEKGLSLKIWGIWLKYLLLHHENSFSIHSFN